MDSPRFCIYCGSRLSNTASFCPACGKAASKTNENEPQSTKDGVTYQCASTPSPSPSPAPQYQAVAAPPSPSETVHLILPGASRHSGFLGLKIESFMIVFTNLRIIFALQTTQMMQENVKRAQLEAQREGKGFFGKWGAQLRANSGKQYWQIPPQQILAEHPSNFAINREQIRSIRMRENYTHEDAASTYTMTLDTTTGKHKFRFGSLRIRDLKKQFQQLYGNVVR